MTKDTQCTATIPTGSTTSRGRPSSNTPPIGTVVPTDPKEAYRIKIWQSARQIIKDEFKRDPDPGGMRYAFLANIAMLLYDHYGVDHTTANKAADDIIKLAFEDTYY